MLQDFRLTTLIVSDPSRRAAEFTINFGQVAIGQEEVDGAIAVVQGRQYNPWSFLERIPISRFCQITNHVGKSGWCTQKCPGTQTNISLGPQVLVRQVHLVRVIVSGSQKLWRNPKSTTFLFPHEFTVPHLVP